MRGSLKYLLIIVALFAGGLLFACGSDDDGDGSGLEEPTAEQSAGDSDDVDDGDSEESDDDSGDSSDELRALAEQFGITEVKVTYTMSGPGVGPADFTSQMILYSKPPDRWRMDITSADGDISMIFDGDSTLMCASEGGEGQCFESPVGGALPVPFLNIFTDPDELNNLVGSALGVDISRSNRQIAGQDANCFSFSGDIDGTTGSGEYCFRDDGVLLLLRAESGGEEEFTMEATEVSDTVSDSDLEPPFEVLDLGDMIP